MLIRELFESDVTRDIPPVVYFHEQRPEHLKAEVEGYIITGGYPEGHPRAQHGKTGIHEQFVRLLRQIAVELDKKGGPELPASWISGFYGSGKSSFAKLLGLALDGAKLPDGTLLSAALLARDDSPRSKEFADAWKTLVSRIQAMAVVFDIGAVARDNEHVHTRPCASCRRAWDTAGAAPMSHTASCAWNWTASGMPSSPPPQRRPSARGTRSRTTPWSRNISPTPCISWIPTSTAIP